MRSNGITPSLSITVTDAVLKHKDSVLDWLEALSKQHGINGIAYNLLHFQGESFDRMGYCKAATDFILCSHMRLHDIVSEDRFNRKLHALFPPRMLFGDCAAVTGNQVVLKANGELSVCQAFCQSSESTIGDSNSEDVYSILSQKVLSAIQEYVSFLPINRQSCLDCDALFTCGGGCYWDSKDTEDGNDAGFCLHSKMMHDWMLAYIHDLLPFTSQQESGA